MALDKDRKPAREEFEVAHRTKELGRPLQRKRLQRRLEDLAESPVTAARHGDEPCVEKGWDPPPREDRAG
ncbi:MAG TPA: hypothetical protein VLI46_04515 [Ramlibacter sp.]|nr:hypothetical protein [Ramlibacter sp.]